MGPFLSLSTIPGADHFIFILDIQVTIHLNNSYLHTALQVDFFTQHPSEIVHVSRPQLFAVQQPAVPLLLYTQ